MGFTVTPNHGLVKPNGSEPVSNWPVQNAFNMDKLDNILVDYMLPLEASSGTDILAITDTAFVNGSPLCGVAFTAPPKGKCFITVSGWIEMINIGNEINMSFQIRNGSTLGSGSVVLPAHVSHRSICAGEEVNGSPSDAQFAGSRRVFVNNLTPGNSYNVVTAHMVAPGGEGNIFHRRILFEPIH